MPNIEYISGGDATKPNASHAFVVHVCNDVGDWAQGFVKAISDRWSLPAERFHAGREDGTALQLGDVQLVDVEPGVTVVNMISQRGIYSLGHKHHNHNPLKYETLYRCLLQVAESAKAAGADLHMPKIGTGAARGDWTIIEKIIESACKTAEVKAYVYTQ